MTGRDYALTDDDALAKGALAARDVRVVPAVWNDAAVDWSAFDLVVIRSAWDWHHEPRAFRDLLVALAERDVPLENRSASRWLDKRYLLDLESRGVRVVPTRLVDCAEDVAAAAAAFACDRVVVKSSLGASAHHTWRADARDGARQLEIANEARKH